MAGRQSAGDRDSRRSRRGGDWVALDPSGSARRGPPLFAALPFYFAVALALARVVVFPFAAAALRRRFFRDQRVRDLLQTPARPGAINALRSIAIATARANCATIGAVHAAGWSILVAILLLGMFDFPDRRFSRRSP